jgi:hypothetical protein
MVVLDTRGTASLWLRKFDPRSPKTSMPFLAKFRAILTDSHFLIPLLVFCVGLALLITLH